MKNGPVLFLGLLAAIGISFGGLVLGSHEQLGRLAPYYDDNESGSFPQHTSGLAARGQLVYADLGCAACHTQQVRRPDYGSDQARGWGTRQSVARDYIYQARPQLGASRLGPDLTNLATRKPTAPTDASLTAFLYNGSSTHPSYKFLFESRPISGELSAQALKVSGGLQLVATERAQTLVAYLLSLNTSYDYPEARPVAAEKKAEEPKK